MKPVIVFCIIGMVSTGCNNLKVDPTHSTMSEAEYLSHHSQLNNRGGHFEPNDSIYIDELLEKQINGKINQSLPGVTNGVIVDGNRIIVSSVKRDNDTINEEIRKSVRKLSDGRIIIIVTEDVFLTYRTSHNNRKMRN